MSFMKNQLYRILLLSFVVSCFTACVNDGGSSGDNSVTTQNTSGADDAATAAFFTTLADDIILPTYSRFASQANALAATNSALAGYCAGLGSPNESVLRQSAQQSWRDVMATWQQIEAMPVGPIAANSANLRNRVYSWPDAVSQCAVDRDVVLASENDSFAVGSRTPQAKGLDALEYLLFSDDLNHHCSSQVTQLQTWNSRPEAERKQLRCNYVLLVAADIAKQSDELLDTWQASGGNFRADLIGAGSEGSSFASQNEALVAVLDALFFIDTGVKDRKLGVPTGLSTCGEASCPDQVESILSGNVINNLTNNVLAFRAAFTGSFDPLKSAVSLDDLLRLRNFNDLAQQVVADVDVLLSALQNYSTDFIDDIAAIDTAAEVAECANSATTPASATIPACGLYGYAKIITDNLKGDVLTVLSLQLPNSVEGDSD